ncbi:CPBP family intramembrane glutamic endopeptidase [Frisingicoccus sp.]|uniref:CPBP family intramembrane glutamic endopeptidase n=2 Tax=Frisingicoccus sp. TaxID=1918627 RepID=UPI002A8077B7|nr:type II CAAX endopeptidase family protein [Frisingicoccus sp.]MDY4835228.1 type II CAAX endopeptidase family protein [Frisingicoccus sp.]MDY4922048.1 type II CAAX endopeptidase family protein [Frisingicoccus sp.]
MTEMKIKWGNRILCLTIVLMLGIQFLMMFMGIYDTMTIVMGSQLFVLLVPLIGSKICGVKLRETFRIRSIRPVSLVFIFLIAFCSFPIISLLNVLSMFFVENEVAGVAMDMYPHGLFLSMLVMAAMPAVGEEVLMRGVIYRSYQRKSPIFALFASAVIFGLIHMNFNQMPYAIFLGIIMVLLVEATDSILSSMFLHFLINGFSTMAGYFTANIVETEVQSTSSPWNVQIMPYVMMSAIMVPALVFLISALFRINGRKIKDVFKKKDQVQEISDGDEIKKKERVVDIWLILSVLISVVMTAISTFA